MRPEGVDARVHRLPVVLTRFVGREQELDALRRSLGQQRLVTIVGPGGSGKTRLAVELARGIASSFEDGVRMVELAPVGDGAGVYRAAAGALGVENQSARPPEELIADAVGSRHQLVLLDNCEHVLEAAAELCARLLAAGDDLRIVATSREALAIPGEARFVLEPLAVADRHGDAGGSEAASLFVDRARLANSSFTLDARSGPIVDRIVRRLAGMPLAIELAAAQLDASDVADLDQALAERAVPAGHGRGVPARQRSMDTSVEWSYGLLDEEERRAFRRLAVFPAHFSSASARALLGPAADGVVERLVRKSLVGYPRPGADGASRYRMLEPILEFALGQLAAQGEEEDVRRQAAEWSVAEAERCAAGFESRGAEEVATKNWFDEEQDNLRTVLVWLEENDRVALVRLALALHQWWDWSGAWREGISWAERTVAGAPAMDARERAGLLMTIAELEDHLGNKSAALAGAGDAIELLRSSGPSAALAYALFFRAVELLSNDVSRHEAQELLLEALRMAEGRYPAEEACAAIGLSWAMQESGDVAGGLEWARRAARIDAELLPGWVWRYARNSLAHATASSGDLEEAVRLYHEAFDLCNEVGMTTYQGELLNGLAGTLLSAQRPDEAAPYVLESIRLEFDAAAHPSVGLGLAVACIEHADPETALHLFGGFREQCRRTGYRIDSYGNPAKFQEPAARARAAVGDERADAAERAGEHMALAELVELATAALTAPGSTLRPVESGPAAKLTRRERELVALVAEGLTDVQIGEKLFISVRTVRSHLDRIGVKTGFRRRAELTRLAVTAGLRSA